MSRVPLVDLSGAFEPGPRRDRAVDAIRRACEDVGFLVITGHGVDGEVVQRIDGASRRFFALPHEEKLAYVGTTGVYRGFTPSQGSALALSRDDESLPDLCELYTVNRFDDPEAARRTNDRWVSTLHRVVTPTGDLGDRISIAFFHQPTYDARIECIPTCTSPDDPPRYEPTTSGGWILSMIERTLY